MNVRRALALIFLGLSFGSLFSGGIVEGTVIHTSMHDFSQKKLVEELVPGDFVISFDFKKSMFCQSKVAEKNIKEVYQIVEIILEAGGVEEKIYTTVDEKIYLPRCWEWREAQKLKAGQFLQRYPLASIPIKEINELIKYLQSAKETVKKLNEDKK